MGIKSDRPIYGLIEKKHLKVNKPEPDARPIPSPPSPRVGKTKLEIKETDTGVEIELGEFVINIRRK